MYIMINNESLPRRSFNYVDMPLYAKVKVCPPFTYLFFYVEFITVTQVVTYFSGTQVHDQSH